MRAFVVDEPRSGALRALNYAPAVERIRRAGSDSARPLHAIVKAFGPAYGTAFARLDCSPEHGVELLSQSDMFAMEPRGRIIRRDSMPHPERHLIAEGQVLVAGAGTLGENELYGRAIIADERLAGRYLSQDGMALVFEEPNTDFALFSYAWLMSPTGTEAIRSTSYGTKILRFREELLSSIPVPLAPDDTVRKVAHLVRTSVRGRESYLERLRSARAIVAALPDAQEAQAMCADKRRKSAVWDGPFPTLSAWTFASTRGALAHLQRRWSARLADFVEPAGIFAGLRFSRVGCRPPHGIPLMSQRDAFMVRPAPRRIAYPAVPAERLFARPGTILVGAQGNIGDGDIFGRAVLVEDQHARSAFTQHLLRVVPRQGFEHELAAFVTTDIGFRLIRSTAVGTAQRSVRIDLLRDLPMPSLSDADRHSVRTHLQRGLAEKLAADTAEAEAIRIIEQEVLPQWLA